MELKRSGTEPSARGPAEYFTGTVRIDPLFKAPAPARTSGAQVTFEPCARSNWHTHPLGQTLIVTWGFGLVQSWGGPIRLLHPGDVLWCPPGEKHWHGASPTTAMTHIAIQEELNGKVVDWLEKVDDGQYTGRARDDMKATVLHGPRDVRHKQRRCPFPPGLLLSEPLPFLVSTSGYGCGIEALILSCVTTRSDA